MKQLSLEEFKKNPNRKVVTRDGMTVRILCTDSKNTYPIVALVRNGEVESTENYMPDGSYLENEENKLDLFFDVPLKHGWVNLYRTEKGMIIFGNVRETKEDALGELENTANICKHIDTIHIEWEE